VDSGSDGAADITIHFAELPAGILGAASIDVDSEAKTIRGVIIVLTTLLTIGWYILDDEDYKKIAAHELGHAVGLSHGGPSGTLTHPEVDLLGCVYTSLDQLPQGFRANIR